MIQSLKPIHGISVGIWTSGKSSQRRRERAARQWRTAARMSKKAGSPGRWSYYWVLLSPRGTWWYLEMWLEESNEGELLNICADYCGDGIVKKKKKKVESRACHVRQGSWQIPRSQWCIYNHNSVVNIRRKQTDLKCSIVSYFPEETNV